VLATFGPAVVAKLQTVWPTLPSPGRRRVVRVLARYAETDESARSLLKAALDDQDADVRSGAFDALVAAGPTGRTVIAPRIAQADDAGDAAALALARTAPAESIQPLLAALDAAGGRERAALREAIATSCRSGGTPVVDVVRDWSKSGSPGVGTRAALALALAGLQGPDTARPLATEIIAGATADAQEFEDRWRLVQAARSLPSSADVDAWLAGLAKDEERWMLRAAALEALAERKAAQGPQLATAALMDAYPRVRAAAATALAEHPETQKALAEHALRDRWPLVRAAALDAIAGQPGALPYLRKGVSDGARLARAAAIRGLTRVRSRQDWPLVKARIEDKEEWPEVLTEGIHFAGELCVTEARNSLLALVRRGMKPDAWAPDAELGLQAFEALQRLGGESAKSAIRLANSGAAPAAYRQAAEAPRGSAPTCPAER
jgi:HEAT repeat protein